MGKVGGRAMRPRVPVRLVELYAVPGFLGLPEKLAEAVKRPPGQERSPEEWLA
jgi:hypothetical protein